MPNVEIKYMTSLEITPQRNDKECQRRSSLPMRFLGFEGCALFYGKPEEVKHAKRSY
jgi:hypothetical protein